MDPKPPVMPSAASQRARTLQKPGARRLAPVRAVKVVEEDEDDDSPGRPSGFALWWPTLLGIALAFAAPRIWDQVQSSWGELGLRFVFPYLLLASRPELGIGQELATNLSQLMLYLQFPIEGLIVTWGMARGGSFFKALAQVLFIHGLGVFVLWLLSQPLNGR